MRVRLLAATLAIATAACSAGPQTALPSNTAVATASEVPTPAITSAPAPSVARTPVLTPIPKTELPAFAPTPTVRVRSNTFTIAAMPALVEASAEERKIADAMVKGWAPMYLEMLDKTRASFTAENRQIFDSFVVPGPYSEVVRRSLGALLGPGVPTQQRTFSLTQLALEHVYAKPWGRVAFVDAYLAYDDKSTKDGTTTSEPRVARVRLVNQGGFFMRVFDGYDTVLGRWINGDFPRYSALALESEAPYGVGAALQRESYVKGEQYPHSAQAASPTVTFDTPFAKVLDTAIKALDDQYKRGDFVERRFDNATATIVSFEPATFIGDGVVTVRLEAQRVTVDSAGKPAATPVTRTLRFYRITRDGVAAGWQLVDEQAPGGAWLSGGDLALAQIDVSRG
ncbi:MAG TPA: hypothetical protein VGK15_00245 [Candidatus Limnocylindria bacterium]